MSLLASGIYTVPEASRLIGVHPNKIRGWVAGYPRTQSDPIIRNQIEDQNGQLAFSFTNLMEARFVNFFSQHGVNARSIRLMAEEARRILSHPHPFATNIIFTTDGERIFATAADKAQDKKLYDLKSKNFAFYRIIKQSFKEGVEYDPSGEAMSWRPRKHIAPHVILNPKMAFGQPVMETSGTPTRAIFDAFRADGETYESVGYWFEVPPEEVEEAVTFEFEIARTA